MPAFSHPDSDLPTSIAYDATAIRRLTECRSEFLRFFRRHLSRPEDAEDAFQDFCVKVVRAVQSPEDGKIDAWLGRILRNTLTDYYRRRATRQRAEAAYEREAPETVVHADANQDDRPCHCVRDLVPTLRPDYAEIVRRADLDEEPRERIAADLGLTANNIGVRLHRARRALKEKIEKRCPNCCNGSFRNCDCGLAAHGGGSGRPKCPWL
jgi:RNA polymerase sigma-70 factor (ECF subfamily)